MSTKKARSMLCTVHADVEHGGEAEELRAGIEKLVERATTSGRNHVSVERLQELLDDVDARDSLVFTESRAKRRERMVSR